MEATVDCGCQRAHIVPSLTPSTFNVFECKWDAEDWRGAWARFGLRDCCLCECVCLAAFQLFVYIIVIIVMLMRTTLVVEATARARSRAVEQLQ